MIPQQLKELWEKEADAFGKINHGGILDHDIRYFSEEGYIAGCEAEYLRDKWISVEDRLPEAGERVLVFGADIGVSSNSYYINLKGKWVNTGMGRTIQYSTTITHWMPLPKPPKAK